MRQRWVPVLCAALLSAGLPSRARAAASETRVLPNGLQVTLQRDESLPLTAVDLCFRVGSANDPRRWPGLAKVIGVLLADAPTRHLPGGASDRLLEAAGLLSSKPKVRVGRDVTHLSYLVPAQAAPLVTWMAAERIGFVADGVDPYVLENAIRKVLDEEKKDSDAILSEEDDIARRAVFGPAHPYGFGGVAADLGKVPVELVRKRLRSLYGAGNTNLTVSGNGPRDAAGLVEKYFGALEGTKIAPLMPAPAAPESRDVRIDANVRFAVLALAWPTAAFTTRDDVALDVLSRWLRVELEAELVQRQKLATEVFARQASSRLGSVFQVRLGLPDGGKPEPVIAAVDALLERVRARSFDSSVWVPAKRSMVVGTVLDSDGLVSQAAAAGYYPTLLGDVRDTTRYVALYESTGAEDLAGAVARNLAAKDRIVLHVVPSPDAPKAGVARSLPAWRFDSPSPPEARPTRDGELWYQPPQTLSSTGFSPPAPIERATSGGSRVLLLPRDLGSVVNVRVVQPLRTRPPFPGLVSLLSDLLSQTVIDGEPLWTRLSRLGVSLRTFWNMDSMTLELGVDKALLGDALSLVFRALESGQLPDERFELYKRGRLKNWAARDQEALPDPWPVMMRWAYPKAHRYGGNVGTAVPDLQKLDRGTLEKFLREATRSPPSVLLVGNLDADSAARIVEQSLGRKRGAPPQEPRGRFELAKGAHLEDVPGGGKTALLFFCPVPSWGTEGFPAALALRWLWTGRHAPSLKDHATAEHVSLLDQESNVAVRRDTTFAYARIVVPSAEAAAATRSVLDELADLATKGPGPEGLAQARRESLDDITDDYASSTASAALLTSMLTLGADTSAQTVVFRKAQRLTAADVQGVAARCQQTLRVVGLGDAKDVAAELEKRKFGPVAVHAAEEAR